MSFRKVQSSDEPAGGDGGRGRLFMPPGRARIVRRLSLVIAAIALAATLLYPGPVPDHDSVTKAVARPQPAPPPRPATVTVSARPDALTVPRSFLGLSVEYWAVPHFAQYGAQFDRVLSLIHVPGEGPVVLRVGGDSADRTFWAPDERRPSRWAYDLTTSWWRGLGTVVRRTGARVIVDLNLVTGSAYMGAQWAREAEAALPRGSIIGFEVGNEPDIYSNRYWSKATSSGTLRTDLVPLKLSSISYLDEFEAYASALSQVAPNVPLLGPAVANPSRSLSWVATLLSGPHAGLGIVSVHRYPYSGCVRKSSSGFPTIARLLSEKASAGVASAVAPAARLAHAAGLPLRLTELNSITCGGKPGVSDTFATALWAPDTLFELMRVGVQGANIHVRDDAVNAAFYVGPSGLRAQPLLYGLTLFARTLGPGAQLIHAYEQASPSLHLKAWAVRLRGGLVHVLLIDKGPYAVRVNLRLPATAPATVQRLLAPSVRSRWGETLAGQHIASNGRWAGHRTTQVVARSRRGYEIVVPRYSAALVSVRMQGPPPATAPSGLNGRHVLVGVRTRRPAARPGPTRSQRAVSAPRNRSRTRL